MTVSGLTETMAAAWTRARQRFGWVDHLARAAVRYDEVAGGRLAAAVTYYAFFASFALALLAFAALGFFLDDPVVLRTVQRYLAENLPRLDVQALRDARDTAGVLALLGLPLTGLYWVDAMRSAIRAIWRLDQYPGSFLVRHLVDLLVLTGLGLLLATSLAAAFGTRAVMRWLVVDQAGSTDLPSRWLLAAVGFLLGVAVNTLLSVAVLTGLPRLRMSLRRVLIPALMVAAGLEALKTLGGLYIAGTEANPAYHVVAGAVGLLVFLRVLNQLILFAAAITATSATGHVVDLAADRSVQRSEERTTVAAEREHV